MVRKGSTKSIVLLVPLRLAKDVEYKLEISREVFVAAFDR